MLSYDFEFTYPVVVQGIHLGDVEVRCAATISYDDGGWGVDEWNVLGAGNHLGEIKLKCRHCPEEDPSKELLRRAINDDWNRRRPYHYLEVERLVREAIADGGSDYHYERSREAA